MFVREEKCGGWSARTEYEKTCSNLLRTAPSLGVVTQKEKRKKKFINLDIN